MGTFEPTAGQARWRNGLRLATPLGSRKDPTSKRSTRPPHLQTGVHGLSTGLRVLDLSLFECPRDHPMSHRRQRVMAVHSSHGRVVKGHDSAGS
jgi:hypothetical protein